MKIILAFLSVIGIFLLVGGILFTAGAMLIGEEELNTQIVSTNHTVTGGWVDVKIIDEPEDPFVNSGLCYHIENGFKIYENGAKVPLF